MCNINVVYEQRIYNEKRYENVDMQALRTFMTQFIQQSRAQFIKYFTKATIKKEDTPEIDIFRKMFITTQFEFLYNKELPYALLNTLPEQMHTKID